MTVPRKDAYENRLKTLDIGFNGVSVSTDLQGTILQISAFHPKHGIVLAEPYEQFDGTKFRDTPYVREYRSRMLRSMKNGVPGFGLRFEGEVQELQVDLDGLGRATVSYRTNGGLAITVFLRVGEDGEVVQSAEIRSLADSACRVSFTMDCGISVNRASYGQLTEGGPIPIPRSENKFNTIRYRQGFVITNTPLGAHLRGWLEGDGKLVDTQHTSQEETFVNSPVVKKYTGFLEIPPRGTRVISARFILQPGVVPHAHRDTECPQRVGLPKLWKTREEAGRFIVRRNLEYILGNCAIPVPQSRQAVRFLIDTYLNLKNLTYPSNAEEYAQVIKATVKGHLIWIFRYAQRPHKFWHRSYLTTGRPKDGPVFQLDQQCYPLLELCDVCETFPEERELVEEILRSDAVSQVLDLIETKRDARTGLFPTDETPGDDAVEHPFHFSSHVLLWHSLSRLAKVAAQFMAESAFEARLATLAMAVRTSTLDHFLCPEPASGKPTFSYLVDGAGQQTFYHDANDLPTLFAPSWGFTKTDSENQAWHNTMHFAFSTANEDGYYAGGAFEGLGSVHTRNPWTLGYFQQWRYSQMSGDRQAEAIAWDKICGVMLWDGMFSEAVDGHSGEVTSKAWFSWPGSMIGSGLLEKGNRERYL
ncbi:hypothetical protein CLCR_00796 [Cladophialophora carrionii]|uniref:Six-hairpin glycosidase-like protein n=1 Tax=Cladophialophora carrionii TaxID=86049 RepID=A0A1C1D111_9EURO|nr:hypothetical protein CLCR_00796 [Cladophialophora carrionii]